MKEEEAMSADRYVYPVGTRVLTPEGLRGTIERHEYHESGRISPIPYLVKWDNPWRAQEVRGFPSCYVSQNEFSVITPLPGPLLRVRCWEDDLDRIVEAK